MSTTTVTGTSGEDRSDYTRDESRAIRRRSLRLLGSLVSPLRGQLVLAAAVLVVSTALRVAGPALIAYGIDNALPAVIQNNDWMPTIMVVAIYLTAGIGGAVLIGWYVVVAARLTQAVMLDLRKRIFLHTQRLSLEFHESYTSGRIISRQTSDLDTIRELLDGGLNELVSGVLYGLFTLAALFLIDWQSGLVLAVMGVPLYLLMRWFYGRSQVIYRESRVISAQVIVKFVESMTGIRAVKAFRKEPRNDEEFGDLAGQYRDVNMRSIRLFGTFEPGLMAVASVSVALVLLWGGGRVIGGALEIGVLAAAVLYVRNFFARCRRWRSSSTRTSPRQRRSRRCPACSRSSRRCPIRSIRSTCGAPAATCGSTMSPSGTRRGVSSCRTSPSTSPRDRRSPWSARPVQARRPSPSSSRASTTPRRGR